jgi:hypothetical protein
MKWKIRICWEKLDWYLCDMFFLRKFYLIAYTYTSTLVGVSMYFHIFYPVVAANICRKSVFWREISMRRP